jgi:hypothetical protein
MNPAQQATAIALFKQGKGAQEIATFLGLNYDVVWAFLQFGALLEGFRQDLDVSGSTGSGTGIVGSAITLQTNGVLNPVQNLLNLIAGTNITLVPNLVGGVTINSTGGGGGGGTPGGTVGQVQFNNGGVFGGIASGATGQILVSNGLGLAPSFQSVTLPQTFAAVPSNWLNSYSSVTGLFTAAQPSVTDVNGAAPLASPAFTGVPTAPTAAPGTSTTQLATTAFVTSATGAFLPLAGGTMTGSILFSPDNTLNIGASGATRPANIFVAGNVIANVLQVGANDTGISRISAGVVSVGNGTAGSITGTIVVVTQTPNNNSTKAASTAYVDAAIATTTNASNLTSGTLAAARGGVAPGTTGGFFGGWVWPGAIGAGTGLSSASPTSSNNQVYVIQFTLPYAMVVNKIVCKITAGNGAGDLWGYGIYSSDGTTKLVDTGAISTASAGLVSTTITPATLPAGTYFFAQTSSGTTATSPFFAMDASNLVGMFNANRQRYGLAANVSAAGVLPASLGAISNTPRGTMLVWFEN